jgi:Cu/Ag efflux protein CusF
MKTKVKIGRLSAVLLTAAGWSIAAHALVVTRRPVDGYKAPIVNAQAAKGEDIGVFRGVGVVTGVDKATNSLTVRHEAIKGLMPSMEMTFGVDPRSLIEAVRAGDKIEFAVDGKTYTLKKILVVKRGE